LDLTENAVSIALSEEFWKTGKPVSAICHGPAALVNVKDPSGKHIVSGRKVTCFSNVEEKQAKLTHQIPFLVEDRLKEVLRHLLTLPNFLVGWQIRKES
jgi:putative intracellular protease/amidase